MRIIACCTIVIVLTFCLLLSSCFSCGLKQNPDELRQKTANATAELKTDAKAVAQGVKEGLKRDDRVDINKASAKELTAVPGITQRAASRIVENRPYDNPRELVTKKVISQAEYDKIASQVKAGK